MVGRDLSSFYKKEHKAAGARTPVLEVADLSDGGRVKSGSFTLHAGEVLGLAGLVGAGRTELARLIYGAEPRTAGTVKLNGQPVDYRTPGEAIDGGVVYLTEDRKAQGLFLDMTCGDNINLGVIGRDAKWGGWLDRARARLRSLAAIKAMAIRVPGPEIPVGTLSGGNQQKVLLSRLLETQPKVLILDEPTRGVDIGAKSEIYRIIDELAQSGAAVLVISSELPEVVGIADRVVVMREGRTVGEVSRPRHHRRKHHGTRNRRRHRKGGSMSDTVSASKPERQRLRQEQMRALIRSIGMLPVLIVLGILVQLAGIYFTGEGRFLTWQNLSIVAQQASINAVLGAGMTFVILTGGIDLSVGSILAAAAVVGLEVSQVAGDLGVLAALLTGLVIGLGNGVLIAFLRLPPFIVTLGSLTAVRGLARLLGNDTTVFNSDLPFAFIGNDSIGIEGVFEIPWLVVIAFLVIVGSWLILRRTVLGVHIYAVGGNRGRGAAVRHQGLGGAAVRLRRLRSAGRTGRRDAGGAAVCRERLAAWPVL